MRQFNGHFAAAATLAFSIGVSPAAFSASEKRGNENLLCFLTTTLSSGGKVEMTTRRLSIAEAETLGATVDQPVNTLLISPSGMVITIVDCLNVTGLNRKQVDLLNRERKCTYDQLGKYQCN